MKDPFQTFFAIVGLFVLIYTIATGEIPHLFPRHEPRSILQEKQP